MNIMTKTEAKAELRKVESDLRQANVVLEMQEQEIRYIEDKIAELQAIINKPDRWQDSLVQPDKENYFYLKNSLYKSLAVDWSCENERKPEHAFRTQEQAELIREKTLLMWEMHNFAHVRNERWMPDWQDEWQEKYGIVLRRYKAYVEYFVHMNRLTFGVAVKSREIAEEMLEIFGERIEKVYNKQY